jgi:hypothetical protein
MKTKVILTGILGIMLVFGLVLAGCGGDDDSPSKTQAEKNAEALQKAGEITINAPKADAPGTTVSVRIKIEVKQITITIGETEIKYDYTISDSFITLKGAGEGDKDVSLGYVINADGTLTISGLDKIKGGEFAGGEVRSDANENLKPPADDDDGKVGNITSVNLYTTDGSLYTGTGTVQTVTGENSLPADSPSLGTIGSISADGKLTLNLPANPPESALYDVTEYAGSALKEILLQTSPRLLLAKSGYDYLMVVYLDRNVSGQGISAAKGWHYMKNNESNTSSSVVDNPTGNGYVWVIISE